MNHKFRQAILISSGALLLALAAGVAAGSVQIPLPEFSNIVRALLQGGSSDPQLQSYVTILSQLRLPRVVLMALTGAALAGSGAAYQGLFRNPLADPYLIGVASGAGLGAVLAIQAKWNQTDLGLMAVPMAAFLGAMITILLVYAMARVGKTVPTTNLILAGVAISSLATAATSMLMITASGEIRHSLIWLLGGASMSGWRPVLAMLPYLLLGSMFILMSGHTLNVLQLGDEQARYLGLPVEKARLVIIIMASMVSAAAVSFTGIIGFVGLMVPHFVRLLWGGNFKSLIPLSFINGATLLIIADILARTLMSPQELPVGVITSLFGAPFFLWVLRRAKQQNYW